MALAVIVGIQAFGENTRKAELDRLTVEAHRVAANAFAWKQTPQPLGGGTNDTYYSSLTLGALGFSGVTTAEGGELQTVTQGGLTYKLVRRERPRTHIHIVNESEKVGVAIFLLGPESECFAYRQDFVRNGQTVYLPALTPPKPAGCSG